MATPAYRINPPRAEIQISLTEVQRLATLGESVDSAARKLNMSPTTFRARLRNSAQIANAWHAGEADHKQYRKSPPKNKREGYDADFDFTAPIREWDVRVFMAVACGYRRWRDISRISGVSINDTVAALDRLQVNILVEKDESKVFTEFTPYLSEGGTPKVLNAAYFLLILLLKIKAANA